jgi:integrase
VTETAIKPNDIVELTWQQIDLNKREIVFQKTLKSQERKLLISEEVSALLEKKNRSSRFVFMTYYKEPYY